MLEKRWENGYREEKRVFVMMEWMGKVGRYEKRG
jgi:hypothetical protein